MAKPGECGSLLDRGDPDALQVGQGDGDRSVASALVIPGGSIPRRRDSRRATTDCAPVRPAPGRRSATSCGHRPRLGCAPTLREWLDGVSDALCISPPQLRDSRPFATAAIRSRRRLPGTTGPRVRSPWPAAWEMTRTHPTARGKTKAYATRNDPELWPRQTFGGNCAIFGYSACRLCERSRHRCVLDAADTTAPWSNIALALRSLVVTSRSRTQAQHR
jgi:hypothetical protein